MTHSEAILLALVDGPASGAEIAERLGFAYPSVLSRLCELRKSGEVIGTRTRPSVFRLVTAEEHKAEPLVETAKRTQPPSVFHLARHS